jgi:hypothetical protein
MSFVSSIPKKYLPVYRAIRKHLKDERVEVKFSGLHFREYAGFFALLNRGKKPFIFICTKNMTFKEWFQTLIHEYFHYCQWKNKLEINKQFNDHHHYYDKWLRGESNCSKKRIDLGIKVAQRLELDCEQRTLKFLMEIGMVRNPDPFVQVSNANMLAMELTKKTRTPNFNMSNHPSIWKKMPVTWLTNYEVPEWFEVAVSQIEVVG